MNVLETIRARKKQDTQKNKRPSEKERGNYIMKNENTLKNNFNSEEVNKLRETIEQANIKLEYADSYNKLIYDKLEEVEQNETINRLTGKQLTQQEALTTYQFKVQHNIKDYINLNFSLSEELEEVKETLDEIISFMFKLEKSIASLEASTEEPKKESNADNIQ